MIMELKNSNGKIVGSKEYFENLNNTYLKNLMPNNAGRNKYYLCYQDIEKNTNQSKYKTFLSDHSISTNNLYTVFEPIAKRITTDISRSQTGNYIKDVNGNNLITALHQLKQCKIKTGQIDFTIKKINQLCWYIDVNSNKVKKLQSLLNQLGYGPIEISGVYDKKTANAWLKFAKDIEERNFSKLIHQGNTNVSAINVFVEYSSMIQIVEQETNILPSSSLKNLLSNVNRNSKIIKIGRRFVIVASLALDAIELGAEIEADLTDADKKLGKKTVVAITKISLSWLGLGASSLVAVGATAVGGPVTGAIAGFAAAMTLPDAFESTAEDVVDFIIDLTDWQIE